MKNRLAILSNPCIRAPFSNFLIVRHGISSSFQRLRATYAQKCMKICIFIIRVQKIHKYTKRPAISPTSVAKSWKHDCNPRKRKHPHLRPRTQWYVETYSKHRRYNFWAEVGGTLSPPLSEKEKAKRTKTRSGRRTKNGGTCTRGASSPSEKFARTSFET